MKTVANTKTIIGHYIAMLDNYEMAIAPTQKHLSGLSEVGAHLVTTEALHP